MNSIFVSVIRSRDVLDGKKKVPPLLGNLTCIKSSSVLMLKHGDVIFKGFIKQVYIQIKREMWFTSHWHYFMIDLY